jgi:hypothetical protein
MRYDESIVSGPVMGDKLRVGGTLVPVLPVDQPFQSQTPGHVGADFDVDVAADRRQSIDHLGGGQSIACVNIGREFCDGGLGDL